MPLTHSLVQLLQIKNLFDASLAYMNAMKSRTHVLSNFIQGTTWQEQMKNFKKTDGVPLPLVEYFNEIETGNAQGSRSENINLGGFYGNIPCLPPNFSSKLRWSDTFKIMKNRFFVTYFTRKTVVEFVLMCFKTLFIFVLRIYTKHR